MPLLGTGLERPLAGALAAMPSQAMNRTARAAAGRRYSNRPAWPTAGHVPGEAVGARHVTVTFMGRKRGLFTGLGPDCAGAVCFDDLGVPAGCQQPGVSGRCDCLPPVRRWRNWAAARRRAAHKGAFGHVLVIGGGAGMGGAARLAGEAGVAHGCRPGEPWRPVLRMPPLSRRAARNSSVHAVADARRAWAAAAGACRCGRDRPGARAGSGWATVAAGLRAGSAATAGGGRRCPQPAGGRRD